MSSRANWWMTESERGQESDVDQMSTIAERAVEDYMGRVSALGAYAPRSIPQSAVRIPIATELPKSANTGDELRFVADGTNGIIWNLIYYPDGSAYPWKCIGGSGITNEISASESTASTSYTALGTAGPVVSIPLSGEYEISLATYAASATATEIAAISYDIGSTGAVDADNVSFYVAAANASGFIYRDKTKTFTSATTLTAKYRTVSGNSCTFDARRLKALPIRVGRP